MLSGLSLRPDKRFVGMPSGYSADEVQGRRGVYAMTRVLRYSRYPACAIAHDRELRLGRGVSSLRRPHAEERISCADPVIVR